MRLKIKHWACVMSSDITYGGEIPDNMGTKSIDGVPSMHEDLLWGKVGVEKMLDNPNSF